MADYEIQYFDDRIATVIVLFDGAPYPITLMLPVAEDGSVPVGNDLHEWIMQRRPVEVIERQKRLKNGVPNAPEVRKVVTPLPPPPAPDPDREKKELELLKTKMRLVFGELLNEFNVISE